jgi:hypothetical protein
VRHNWVLIDPEPEVLVPALREVVEAANGRARRHRLGWPLDDCNRCIEEWAAVPEGWRQWTGADGKEGGKGCSIVVLAWWSDGTGRKHCRVVGVRGDFMRAERANLLCPSGQQAPAVALVYPDAVFRSVAERDEWLAWCACGALGRPEELGWMGGCCGPCHDRREEGQEPPSAWPDPVRGTWHSPHCLTSVAFAPDRALVLVLKGYPKWAVLESPAAGGWQPLCAVEMYGPVVFHPDGRSVLSARSDGSVQRTDLDTGAVTDVLQAGPGAVGRLAVSPDGTRIATQGYPCVQLWDATDGRLLHRLESDQELITCLAFSPDGKRLAIGACYGVTALWDAVTGRHLVAYGTRQRDRAIAALSFSPDGKTLAACVQPTVRVSPPQRAATEEVLLWGEGGHTRLRGHPWGTVCLAWGLDGATLVTGGNDGTLKAWDVGSGVERVTLAWHRRPLTCVAFSPDGRTLVSVNTTLSGGAVKLWPVEVLDPPAGRK